MASCAAFQPIAVPVNRCCGTSEADARRRRKFGTDTDPRAAWARCRNCIVVVGGGWPGHTQICADIGELCAELEKGAALALITEEAVADGDLSSLSDWVSAQPPWSDMPIILLTAHDDVPTRVDRATRYQDILGNVTYLERPFHPTTLANLARSAIRSRRRQYEARASLERYMLLARELQHRTKNLLAVIQSIASASLSSGPARETYFARLHALAVAQDLVMEGDGRGASIRRLVEQALDSFGSADRHQGTGCLFERDHRSGICPGPPRTCDKRRQARRPERGGGIVTVEWHQNMSRPARSLLCLAGKRWTACRSSDA